ncbi:anti-repressor SinI family protein [Paenibacillus sp. GYB003]|uniref:anti-repressor SinI family protein n=1 Tax=Paenibacillus sp. GYB003 TaxID=2994392 RepID=UPI002F969217
MQGLRHYQYETKKLDPNWIHLMMAAKQIGITVEEIRQFLWQSSPREKKPEN